MSLRAQATAEDRAIEQAQVIVDSSLTLVFRPDDLERVATGERVQELARSIGDVVVDASDFETVTLFSTAGQILFSTRDGGIGQRLVGERDRIRQAYRGEPQSRLIDDTLSVMVGLHFPSGVGGPAAVELTRRATDIGGAAAPWRTNMFFLGGTLALVLLGRAALGRRAAGEVSASEPLRMRVPVIPTRQPGAPARKVAGPPQPGLREEAEARRRAEDRAQAAEKRLVLLQDQYRATLEELHTVQRTVRDRPDGRDRALEERAVKAESAARTLEQRLHGVTAERDRIAGELLARRDAVAGPGQEQLQQAEAEAMGLRAELEGAQTQLSLTIQELTSLQRQAERSRELQEELDAAQLEALHARDAMDAMQTELRSARTELDDARGELRALRSEEQRAAELTDELRTAKAELGSLRASHRAELIEREAELEEKVRAVREEFQAQLADAEARSATATGAELELDGARERIAALELELADRQDGSARAGDDVEEARNESRALAAQLADARALLEETSEALGEAESALEKERGGRGDLQRSADRARAEALSATERAEQLAEELELAVHANTELNRRLQEIEARRALEVAEDEGRAHMDELLSATQERLAGQSEKLMAAEERARELERQVSMDAERLEVLEAELRQHQMADQIREIQGPKHEHAESVVDTPAPSDGLASSPFVKEMSMDARKTISRIMGVVQLLKHKRDAKDQGQLVQQLTAHARRLDNTIRDLSDVDSLVTGSIDLDLRNTDLESLIRRVVDESGVEDDHDVRVEAEPTSIAVDRTRTEQILGGLLRSASDRTPADKTITVRLLRAKGGGAFIAVEDAESSSATSLSPMVRRLAEVQGGSVKVEAREGGGSSFQVFLPHNGSAGDTAPAPAPPVEEGEASPSLEDDPNHWVKAEQALVRELRELSQGKAKK